MLKFIQLPKQFTQNYWPLLKFRQTALLIFTGLAGFASAFSQRGRWQESVGLVFSLFLAISGCTVLNMVFDRDIDAQMKRTSARPIASGKVNPQAGLITGGVLLGLGLLLALLLSPLYALLVLTGSLIDIIIYTLWLKRRTAWSILPGGLAGAMPILAGRALALNQVDGVGLLLALAILTWIPAHNLALSMVYAEDYQQACLPTFLTVYGTGITRLAMVFSCLLTSLAMTIAFVQLGVAPLILWLIILAGCGLSALAVTAWKIKSTAATLFFYKYASIYMLGCMLPLFLNWIAPIAQR